MGAEPLEKRPLRLRNPLFHFYCPLCRSERAFIYGHALQKKHYWQMALISLLLMTLTLPVMGIRIFIWPLVVWPCFEAGRKILFRKEVPCPHCGFDMIWYRKDVKMAKKLVAEFWAKKQKNDDDDDGEEDEQILTESVEEQAKALF